MGSNNYLRTCKKCKSLFRTQYKHSRICPECRNSKNINSKHHKYYIDAVLQREMLQQQYEQKLKEMVGNEI